MEKQKPSPKETFKGCLILLVLCTILGIIMQFGGCFEESPESKLQSDKITAYSFAQQEVERRLVSPSSADYPSFLSWEDHVHHLGENKFQVQSWVDSENGFGVKIRTNFQVLLTLSEDGETARILSVEVGN